MLRLERVSKLYGDGDRMVRALDDVTLHIRAGEFAAVVGRSGSGKSTLMHILGCLDLPTAGDYYLDGVRCTALGKDARAALRNRRIGFVFQSFNLLPHCTALENVELPLRFRGIPAAERRERALDALSRVGLADRRAHRPSELSGGQAQRVALARAIAAEPALILADEPTGSLDRAAADQVLDLLGSLNARGATVVLITHDPAAAARAQRTLTLCDGRLTA